MPKLPNFPDLERLRGLAPSVFTVKSGTRVHRIYRRGGDHPTLWNAFRHYGPTSARFDHHLMDSAGKPQSQARGILYLASDIPTAVAEVFQANRTLDHAKDRSWLVSFDNVSELTLLDLTDTFPVLAGGSMKLISGATLYAQNLSRGFYDTYEQIHGLYYPSSLTNRPIMALYERAQSVSPFPEVPRFHRALGDALLIEPLRNLCRDIGYEYT